MNQKHILPCPRFLVFSASSLPQSFSFLPTYLTSFCSHSVIRAQESLKQEGRRGRAKLGAGSKRVKVVTKKKRLKRKGRSTGQNRDPKVRG
jgi:hypothetical protein